MKENLSLFLQLAKSDKEEAKRIFFGKTFKEYYLQDEHKLQAGIRSADEWTGSRSDFG